MNSGSFVVGWTYSEPMPYLNPGPGHSTASPVAAINKRRLLRLGALLPLLLACSTVSTLTPRILSAGTPSPSSFPIDELSPIPSIGGAPEATASPSESPPVEDVPAPAVTPTPWLPPLTSLPTAPSPLSCKLNWQSPKNHVIYNAGDVFTMGWNVTNTGSTTWNPSSVEFTYVGGAKLYDGPLVHLKASVSPGQSVVLSVEMRAPRNSTTYTTYWSLRTGSTYFCPLALWIYVQ